MEILLVKESKDRSRAIKGSTWVLISNNQKFLQHPRVLRYIDTWEKDIQQRQIIWTDDYSSLLELLK